MAIMTDGTGIGEGMVRVEVRRHALSVMVGKPAPVAGTEPEVILA
jgi:hypothetical protein